jgi:hypothetical protein
MLAIEQVFVIAIILVISDFEWLTILSSLINNRKRNQKRKEKTGFSWESKQVPNKTKYTVLLNSHFFT